MRLHDVPHQPSHLLGVGDTERGEALTDQRAQGGLVEPLRQVTLTEFRLEADLGHLGRRAVARFLELGERLQELLAIGADDVEDEGVVHLAREALRRAPLHELRLEHAHDVGGPQVLVLDGLLQRVVELLFETHGHLRRSRRRTFVCRVAGRRWTEDMAP